MKLRYFDLFHLLNIAFDIVSLVCISCCCSFDLAIQSFHIDVKNLLQFILGLYTIVFACWITYVCIYVRL